MTDKDANLRQGGKRRMSEKVVVLLSNQPSFIPENTCILPQDEARADWN
jgi:hypothetical protein